MNKLKRRASERKSLGDTLGVIKREKCDMKIAEVSCIFI